MASSRIFVVTAIASLVIGYTNAAASLKGTVAGYRNSDNSLPVRRQQHYHRQGQELPTLPGLNKKENEDTSNTKEKVVTKEDKTKKQKEEGSKFGQLVASNDCQSSKYLVIVTTKSQFIEKLLFSNHQVR